MIENLNDDTFIIYAIKSYDKPNCIMAEFEEDIKRIKYIKRLIKRYMATGDLKERLILNHIKLKQLTKKFLLFILILSNNPNILL